MKVPSPAFGFISGSFSTIGLLPHLFILVLIWSFGIYPKSETSFIIFLAAFTVGAKILGEWLFCDHCKKRMASEGKLENWNSAVNRSLFSDPNVIISLMVLSMDFLIDATLIYFALKLPIPPLWIFLTLLGSQAMASPVQGFSSDYFSQKNSLLFALSMTMLFFFVLLAIPFDGDISISTFSIGESLGISSFSATTQIFLVLFGKGILANTTVIARAAIATVVKEKAMEKFSNT